MPHLARVGHGVDLASDGVELQLQLKKVNGDSVAGMSFEEAVHSHVQSIPRHQQRSLLIFRV